MALARERELWYKLSGMADLASGPEDEAARLVNNFISGVWMPEMKNLVAR